MVKEAGAQSRRWVSEQASCSTCWDMVVRTAWRAPCYCCCRLQTSTPLRVTWTVLLKMRRTVMTTTAIEQVDERGECSDSYGQDESEVEKEEAEASAMAYWMQDKWRSLRAQSHAHANAPQRATCSLGIYCYTRAAAAVPPHRRTTTLRPALPLPSFVGWVGWESPSYLNPGGAKPGGGIMPGMPGGAKPGAPGAESIPCAVRQLMPSH